MIKFEELKEKINQSNIFACKDLDEDEDNVFTKSISFDAKNEEENKLTLEKYDIDYNGVIKEEILNTIYDGLQKDAMSFYLNNFKEKDFTLEEHLLHTQSGMLIASLAVSAELGDFKNFIEEKKNKYRLSMIHPTGIINNTLILANPYFPWTERRIIWLKSKIFICLQNLNIFVDMNETFTKYVFKIQYTLRYPDSFLGYLKEKNNQ